MSAQGMLLPNNRKRLVFVTSRYSAHMSELLPLHHLLCRADCCTSPKQVLSFFFLSLCSFLSFFLSIWHRFVSLESVISLKSDFLTLLNSTQTWKTNIPALVTAVSGGGRMYMSMHMCMCRRVRSWEKGILQGVSRGSRASIHNLPDSDGDANTFASFTFILPSVVSHQHIAVLQLLSSFRGKAWSALPARATTTLMDGY